MLDRAPVVIAPKFVCVANAHATAPAENARATAPADGTFVKKLLCGHIFVCAQPQIFQMVHNTNFVFDAFFRLSSKTT